MADPNKDSLDVHFSGQSPPSHVPRFSSTEKMRRLSISQDLNEKMNSFLTAASANTDKFDIKSDLYTEANEMLSNANHVDDEELIGHHRSEDFPHITYGLGRSSSKTKHHKHDKRKKQLDGMGYSNEALEDKKTQKFVDIPLIQLDSKRTSRDSLPGVDFYVGTSSTDLSNVPSIPAILALDNQQSSVERFKSSYRQPNKDLDYMVKPGSEVKLAIDSHVMLEGELAHRFEPVTGLRHRIESNAHGLRKRVRKYPSAEHRKEYDHSTHEMFVQLDELNSGDNNDMLWRERARWIKFEEDVEEETGKWGKPHVASLSFQSLLELRQCLEKGAVMLDLEAYDLPTIAHCIVEECVQMGLLDPTKRGKVLKTLLLRHKRILQHGNSFLHFVPHFWHRHVGDRNYNSNKNLSYLDLHLERSGDHGDDGTTEKYWRFSESAMLKKNRGYSHPNFHHEELEEEEEDAPISNPKEAKKTMFLAEINKLKEAKEILDKKSPFPSGYALNGQAKADKNHVVITMSDSEVTQPGDENENKKKKLTKKSPKQGKDKKGGKNKKDDKKDDKSGKHNAKALERSDSKRSENSIFKRIPQGAEGTSVLVGALDYIDKPIMAFVRLAEGALLGNLTEVPIPVRFLFVLLGPTSANMDYYEIGRSISTLMADGYFHDIAYHAEGRKDLLSGINEFLDGSIVLPPGKVDKKTLLPIVDMARRKSLARQKLSTGQPPEEPPEPPFDPLKRTGILFGGMFNDIKKRYPHYWSDIKDGLNAQALATFFFIYFACLAPAITFGGLLSVSTEGYIGVSEMLLICCVEGVIISLFAGQPLVISGHTGPILVFEQSLYNICKQVGVNFLAFRCWVGFWVTILVTLLVMFEGLFTIRYITLFTQEIFSLLISFIFIYETFNNVAQVFVIHPLLPSYELPPQVLALISPANDTTFANLSMEDFGFYGSTDNPITTTLDLDFYDLYDWNMSMPNTTAMPPKGYDPTKRQPNTALFCFILTFGTFIIAWNLRIFRNGKFLGRTARRALGDFGIPISIIIMVVVDILVTGVYTKKLMVPPKFSNTDPTKRGWLVNPIGGDNPLPIWAYFGAAIPGLLVSIVMLIETLITSVIVNRPERNLKKGSGYHLDTFLIGLGGTLSGILGLPFVCVATVRSVTHVMALSLFSTTNAPGDRPKQIGVMEQRMSSLLVHVMVGVSILLGPVLKQIPLAVLFGVFLYMGLASLGGVSVFERFKLLFMPVKHHPDVNYVKKVRTWKMHIYTGVQVLALAVLWTIKSTAASLAFPFFILLLIPLRHKILPFIFTEKELKMLDSQEGNKVAEDSDDEEDFYDNAISA